MKNQVLLLILAIVVGVMIVVLAMSNKEEKVMENDGQNEMGEETKILLYFTDQAKEKLVQEYRNVSLNDVKENVYETIVKELIKGPVSSDYVATLPADTKINAIQKEGNKVIVDLSEEVSELYQIYSIVNSLTEVKEVDEVEIRVNGNTVTTEKRV